jgi:hypothetical protein
VLCVYVPLNSPPRRPDVLGRHFFFSSSLPSPLLSTSSVRLASKSVLHIPSPFLLFGEFRTTSEVQRPPWVFLSSSSRRRESCGVLGRAVRV